MKKCDCYCVEEQIIGWHTPVDPKITTVYKCNGTRERDTCSCGGDRTKCDFYPEVREKALPKFGEWISVEDELPKSCDKDPDWSETVLFRITQGHIHSGYRYKGRTQISFYDDDWTSPYWLDESENLSFEDEDVTHWMPLPEPPTEKEN